VIKNGGMHPLPTALTLNEEKTTQNIKKSAQKKEVWSEERCALPILQPNRFVDPI